MDLIAWAFYALITAAALGAVVLHYRLREPAGRGRGLLAGLRGAALALVVLLLFDPLVPTAAGTSAGADTIVLLDASLSMTLPREDGPGTRWEAALAEVDAVGADRVLRFGDEGVEAGGGGPGATRTRLAPGIRAAAEAGARRVIVVTDGGVEDATEALRLAERAGLAVEVRRVGEEPQANAGIVEVEAPAWLEVGEEAGIRVAVAAVGDAGDSLTVLLRRGATELARARIAAPPPGRLSSTTLRFAPRVAAAAPVRLDVALEEADAASADDVRSVYVRIEEEPAGIALVSFRPDQEPRFLAPVLERALGVPVRAWMALPGGRYVRLGAGPEAGTVGTEEEARRGVAEADLVVLHGLGPGVPSWAREAAADGRPALIFPAAEGSDALPFAPGPARPGDWYPAAEVSSSPVAALMAGTEPGDAPPLQALRTPAVPAGWWAPLEARLGRRGEPRPVLLAGTSAGRRVAIALGVGYWRWAFAGGTGRATYDRLWSAVAGWLAAEREGIGGEIVAPVDPVVERGEPVRFRTAASVDSVRLRISTAAGDTAVLDSVLQARGGQAIAGVLPPGHYRFEARAFGPDGPGTDAPAGELTVESYSAELTRVPVGLGDAEATGETPGRRRGGRPLRASAWPYALLVLLLCAEWVLRRRWGLR